MGHPPTGQRFYDVDEIYIFGPHVMRRRAVRPEPRGADRGFGLLAGTN
jgi:hypothetical protein